MENVAYIMGGGELTVGRFSSLVLMGTGRSSLRLSISKILRGRGTMWKSPHPNSASGGEGEVSVYFESGSLGLNPDSAVFSFHDLGQVI